MYVVVIGKHRDVVAVQQANVIINVSLCFCRHEQELAVAAAQPLPDDDDDAFE